MTTEQIKNKLLDKKAKNNNTIDLDAYASGLNDMFDELNAYIDQVESQLREANINALSQHEQADDQKARIKLLSEGYEKLEAENNELLETHEYTKKQNIDVHNEIKPLFQKVNKLEAENKGLTKALETIRTATIDAELPLLKAIHKIAHKTLK